MGDEFTWLRSIREKIIVCNYPKIYFFLVIFIFWKLFIIFLVLFSQQKLSKIETSAKRKVTCCQNLCWYIHFMNSWSMQSSAFFYVLLFFVVVMAFDNKLFKKIFRILMFKLFRRQENRPKSKHKFS